MKKRKLLLQVICADGTTKYIHFCMVDKQLADEYYAFVGMTASTAARVFEKWSIMDFGLYLKNISDKSVLTFRKELVEAIRKQNIEWGISQSLLNDNIIASWVTEHMKGELHEQDSRER